nr:hypothetical protein [Pandoravirus massiliensis]
MASLARSRASLSGTYRSKMQQRRLSAASLSWTESPDKVESLRVFVSPRDLSRRRRTRLRLRGTAPDDDPALDDPTLEEEHEEEDGSPRERCLARVPGVALRSPPRVLGAHLQHFVVACLHVAHSFRLLLSVRGNNDAVDDGVNGDDDKDDMVWPSLVRRPRWRDRRKKSEGLGAVESAQRHNNKNNNNNREKKSENLVPSVALPFLFLLSIGFFSVPVRGDFFFPVVCAGGRRDARRGALHSERAEPPTMTRTREIGVCFFLSLVQPLFFVLFVFWVGASLFA